MEPLTPWSGSSWRPCPPPSAEAGTGHRVPHSASAPAAPDFTGVPASYNGFKTAAIISKNKENLSARGFGVLGFWGFFGFG